MKNIYLRYSLLALVSLLFNIFVYITSPLWALIAATFKLDSLPWILKWVHTHDNPIWGNKATMPTTFKERFKTAVWWLCRNPGYGFDAYILGYKSTEIISQETVKKINTFDTGESALQVDLIQTTKGKIFSYRRDVKLGGGRFIKMWFGWHYKDQAGYRMLKIDFNPFKKVK